MIIRHTVLRLYVCAVLLAGQAFCASVWAQSQLPASESELIAVLTSSVDPAAKAEACKALAIRGGKEAVPALAALLADPQLSSWARIALQTMPDPAAAAALRDALGQLQGRLLIGAINSLAVRGDTVSAPALAQLLKALDADVRSAAAVAIGRVGSPAATADVERLLTTDSEEFVRSAAGEALIRLAERLATEGKSADAVRLFDLVRAARVPKQRVTEATRGAILARGDAGVSLLVELLRSTDKTAFRLGLSVARELAGAGTTKALVEEFSLAPEERKPLLVMALADRNDATALPFFQEVATNAHGDAQAAAARALGRVGGRTSIPFLLDVAGLGEQAAAAAAIDVLARMKDGAVDEAVLGELRTATGKRRLAVIDLAGRRSIAAASLPLLEAIDDGDAGVRVAALTALGATAGADSLPTLIARVGRAADSDATAAAQAVVAVIRRVPDREAGSRQLAAAASAAEEAAQVRFLNVLAAVGGPTALEAITAAARDSRPATKEAGTRLLGEWMTLDAAAPLLELARSNAESKYKTRGLRGYLRLLRQFSIPDNERVKMCREALAAAERDDERMLVLEVLKRYASRPGLDLAVEMAQTPSLHAAASETALSIAEKLRIPKADVEAALAGKTPRS